MAEQEEADQEAERGRVDQPAGSKSSSISTQQSKDTSFILSSTNASGFKFISKRGNRWNARVDVLIDGEKLDKSLGIYATLNEAAQVWSVNS